MIWYILVCSLIGGLSVSVTTGLGAAIVTSVMGDNQVRSSYSRESSGSGLTCRLVVSPLVHIFSFGIYFGDIR